MNDQNHDETMTLRMGVWSRIVLSHLTNPNLTLREWIYATNQIDSPI
jgi:hypothetical protein